MKTSYWLHKEEMGKICFYGDTYFKGTMGAYEECGESLEGSVDL